MSDTDRLKRDADALRKRQLTDPSNGQNAFDYRQMHELLTLAMTRIRAIAGDPNGLAIAGVHNDKMLGQFKGLLDTASKIVSQINKMRNSDQLTLMLLQSHTAAFARALSEKLAHELRSLDTALANVQHAAPGLSPAELAVQIAGVRAHLGRLSAEQLPRAFSTTAEATLQQTQIDHQLH